MMSWLLTGLGPGANPDLIAIVPTATETCVRNHSFPPVPPEVTIALLWHPRLDADPAHRWLRGCVRDACTAQLTSKGED